MTDEDGRATISVVMATYNGDRYLRNQLASLAAQTRAPDELVISDDASTDGTWRVLEEFARAAPFPVSLHQNRERLGWVENFFTGLRGASGSLVAFADQDDVWRPEKLERMERAFAAPDVQLAICSSVATDEALAPIRRRRRTGIVSRALLAGALTSPSGNCMMGRGELARMVPSSDRPVSLSAGHPQAHDEWFLFAARCFGRVAFLREPLVMYRRHAGSVTSSRGEAPRVSWLEAPSPEAVGHLVEVCRSRAEFIVSAISWGPHARDPERERTLRAQSSRYQRLANLLERRRELLAARSRRRAVTGWLSLLLSGGYGRQSRGALGWLALAQDTLWVAASAGLRTPTRWRPN